MAVDRVMRALKAFEGARTENDFRKAKRVAAKCDPLEQLAMVDSIRAAQRRCVNVGV